MRSGHREAQMQFERLGRQLGYRCRRSWTREHPTDGVWLLDTPQVGFDELPVAALEVVVSETGKALRGSISTLEMVSPALGILLVQDHEIRRGLVRAGASPESAAMHLRRLLATTEADLSRSRQRIALWTFDQLQRRTRVTVSRPAA
jgi:hypothetical protein